MTTTERLTEAWSSLLAHHRMLDLRKLNSDTLEPRILEVRDAINSVGAEHAALGAVAEAANKLDYSMNATKSVGGIGVFPLKTVTALRDALEELAAVRSQNGGAK